MTLYRKTPGVRGGFHSSMIERGFCAVASKPCTESAWTPSETQNKKTQN